MATRSGILIEKHGKFSGVYCHNDGYPEWNGYFLLKHFKNARRVKQLIQFGSISSLRRLIHSRGKPHDFDNPQKEVCIFYHRDRGEELQKMKNLESFNDADKRYYGLNYIYIFKNNKWYFSNSSVNELIDLKKYLQSEKKDEEDEY